MKTKVTSTFKRFAKKLHRNQITLLETAISDIQKEPTLGDLKVGDLAGVRVYKFHILHQLILLAYTYDDSSDELVLVSFGPHENFYSNLKNIH